MKIGFDISQTGSNKAGCGYFADSLLLALSHTDSDNEYILYPHFSNHFWDPNAIENARKISASNFAQKIIGEDIRDAFDFWDNMPLDAEFQLGNPDIIHANNYFCPTKLKRAKVVYTLYDLSFLEYPEYTTEHNRWICFNGVFDAANHADFIIAISNYSRDKFLEIFPHFPSERMKVVYPGSRFNADQETIDTSTVIDGLLRDKFWLTVGTLEPRKNLRRLLKAYSIYKSQTNEILPLALAGGKGWLEDDLEEYISHLDLINHVKILSYVADGDLAWLYKNCFAFIYPSLYEGFGLPILEAMSMGAAVITSRTTSIPEVAGDAVCYIDPYQEKDMLKSFSRLVNNVAYYQSLKKLSLQRALKFSWGKCASEVLEMYNHLMTLPKRSEPHI